MKALVIINFKNYKEALGSRALALAKQLSKVRLNGYKIVIAPSLLTLREISKKTKITVFAQHADPVGIGAHTGSISLDELKLSGVKGVILNHSEHKIPLAQIQETISLCKQKKMVVVVCSGKLSEMKKIAAFHPEYIAYEPRELIGGDLSVTQAKPDLIVKAVESVREISRHTKVLCGAGIHSKEDLGQALLLGTSGVLIGHAVPKSKNPRKFLESMLL